MPAFLQRALDGAGEARAAGGRLGDVVGVGGAGVAGELGVDARAARPSVLLIFQQQDAGALAHHEAVALGVEGAAGVRGIVVVARERVHGAEGGDADRRDAALGAAGEHRDGVAAPDHLGRLADGVGAGGAGGDGGEVRPARVDLDRDVAGGDVGDELRDEEGADAVRALVEEHLELVVAGVQPADARADDHADVVGVLLGDLEA